MSRYRVMVEVEVDAANEAAADKLVDGLLSHHTQVWNVDISDETAEVDNDPSDAQIDRMVGYGAEVSAAQFRGDAPRGVR